MGYKAQSLLSIFKWIENWLFKHLVFRLCKQETNLIINCLDKVYGVINQLKLDHNAL